MGVSEIEFAVALVLPPSAPWAATIVITPSALTVPEVTYLLAVKEQTFGKTVLISAAEAFWTASETAVRHDEAARTTSLALALME